MKHIVKRSEPELFRVWKAQETDNWKPTFETLRGDEKKAVLDALWSEQGHICCYCEQRLIEGDSHIEHVRPQSNVDVDSLDFNNLACSCQNRRIRGAPLHCGSLKADWDDVAQFVSPFDSDCEVRFSFLGDGKIEAAASNDVAATTTIQKLGLNIPKLNEARKQAIEAFLDPILSNNDFIEFVSRYLQRDASGRFGPFWTTISCLFGPEAATTP